MNSQYTIRILLAPGDQVQSFFNLQMEKSRNNVKKVLFKFHFRCVLETLVFETYIEFLFPVKIYQRNIIVTLLIRH